MQSNYLTVRQFSKKHPAFTEASLRWLIFNAEPREGSNGKIAGNGIGIAIFRVGRKVLIDEARFFTWVESSNVEAVQRDAL